MKNPSDLRPAVVRVPCSTSNLGAGFDCLGLALDRYLTAAFEPGPGELLLERTGTLAGLDVAPRDDLLLRAFRGDLRRRGAPAPTGVVRVDSGIPVGAGLGSSAAAQVAGLALAEAALAAPRLPRRRIFRAVARREGHPDNAAPAVYGGLVGVVAEPDGEMRALSLPLSHAIGFAFAAPGTAMSTKAARAILPAAVPFGDAVGGLGRVLALVQGLASGDPDLLRIGLADRLHVPYRLPLIPGAAEAVAAAVEAGAWGATISGAGSGLVAVGPRERAAAVTAAMAEALRAAPRAGEVVAFVATPDLRGARTLRHAAEEARRRE